MILPALAMAVQIVLAPCVVEGVPGEARCGSHRVWENRDSKQGRQIDLSIIVLTATSPDRRPDRGVKIVPHTSRGCHLRD